MSQVLDGAPGTQFVRVVTTATRQFGAAPVSARYRYKGGVFEAGRR